MLRIWFLSVAACVFFIGDAAAERGCARGLFPNSRGTCLPKAEELRLPLDANDPMRFEVLEDPDSGKRFIQATGAIGISTPEVFDLFLEQLEGSVPPEIHFHSPGGKLEAGLKLAVTVRARRMTTVVARAIPIGSGPKTGPRELFVYQDPECDSSCAYAFIGGVARHFGVEASFGVHQFSSAEASAEDYQRETAVLAQHLFDMAVDPYLLNLASSKSHDNIRWIKVQEAERMRVIFDDNFKTDFDILVRDGRPYAGFTVRLANTLFSGTVKCGMGNSVEVFLKNDEDTPKDAVVALYGAIPITDGHGERISGYDVMVMRDRASGGRLQILSLTMPARSVRPELFLMNGLEIGEPVDPEEPAPGEAAPEVRLGQEIRIKAGNAMSTLPLVLSSCGKEGS